MRMPALARRAALLFPLTLAVPACGGGADDASDADGTGDSAASACEAAVAHLAACFPDEAVTAPATCDAAAAARLTAQSCDALATGKTDDAWTCLFAPWLCLGGGAGGSTARGAGLEVAVNACMGDVIDSCRAVQSAPCAEVVVQQGRKIVARAFTSQGGRATFADLPDGKYTVTVRARDGGVPDAQFGDLGDDVRPAKTEVEVGGGEAVWADFSLLPGEADDVQACVRYDARLTVKDAAGEVVDRHEVEWSWVVGLDRGEGELEYTRPLFIHHEATASGKDENVLGFFGLYPGRHTLRFFRIDTPAYARKPNPDYAQLVRLYAVSGVEPIEKSFEIAAEDVPADQSGRITFVDPVE